MLGAQDNIELKLNQLKEVGFNPENSWGIALSSCMRGYDGDDNITQEHVATKNAIQVILFQINIFCHQLTQNIMTDFVRFTKIYTNCSEIQLVFLNFQRYRTRGAGSGLSQFLEDQLTLFQPGRADYAHYIFTTDFWMVQHL